MGSSKQNSISAKPRFAVESYIEGILKKDRVMLSRAITLAESNLSTDRLLAEELIQGILPYTGNSIRIGITGIPGVGKSTFIESFGKYLTSINKKVAVLAVDPSSQLTKGSILGDKTRMEELSKDENAFIRPTSAGIALGGVANNTREAILLCEAAGFDVIIVETVGVGQSEAQVRSMVDFFLLLLLGGAGDELQGIKKGIMEMADAVVITKADGENLKKAKQAQADFQHALHLFRAAESGWIPKVLISSALEKTGIHEVWSLIDSYQDQMISKGYFHSQRLGQNIDWFHSSIEGRIKQEIMNSKSMQKKIKETEKKILSGSINPGTAARDVVQAFIQSLSLN